MKKFSFSLLLLSCVLHGSQYDIIINAHKNDIIDGTKKYAHHLKLVEGKQALSMQELSQDIRYIDLRKKECAQVSSAIEVKKIALQNQRTELEKMLAGQENVRLKELNRLFNPKIHARSAYGALADFQNLSYQRQEEVAAQSVVPGIYIPAAVIQHRQQKIAEKEYTFHQKKQERLALINSSLQLIQSSIDKIVADQGKIKLQQLDIVTNVSGYDALRFTYVKLRKDQQVAVFSSFIEKHRSAQLQREREFKVLQNQQEDVRLMLLTAQEQDRLQKLEQAVMTIEDNRSILVEQHAKDLNKERERLRKEKRKQDKNLRVQQSSLAKKAIADKEKENLRLQKLEDEDLARKAKQKEDEQLAQLFQEKKEQQRLQAIEREKEEKLRLQKIEEDERLVAEQIKLLAVKLKKTEDGRIAQSENDKAAQDLKIKQDADRETQELALEKKKQEDAKAKKNAEDNARAAALLIAEQEGVKQQQQQADKKKRDEEVAAQDAQAKKDARRQVIQAQVEAAKSAAAVKIKKEKDEKELLDKQADEYWRLKFKVRSSHFFQLKQSGICDQAIFNLMNVYDQKFDIFQNTNYAALQSVYAIKDLVAQSIEGQYEFVENLAGRIYSLDKSLRIHNESVDEFFASEEGVCKDLAALSKSLDDACGGRTYKELDQEHIKLCNESLHIQQKLQDIISKQGVDKKIIGQKFAEENKKFTDLTQQIDDAVSLMRKSVTRDRVRLLQQIIMPKPKFIDAVTLQDQDLQKLRQDIAGIIQQKKQAFKAADLKSVITNFAAQHGLGQEDQKDLSEVLVESILKQYKTLAKNALTPSYKQHAFEHRLILMSKEVKIRSHVDVANFINIQVAVAEVFVDCKNHLL